MASCTVDVKKERRKHGILASYHGSHEVLSHLRPHSQEIPPNLSTASLEMVSRSSEREVAMQQGGWYNSSNSNWSIETGLTTRVLWNRGPESRKRYSYKNLHPCPRVLVDTTLETQLGRFQKGKLQEPARSRWHMPDYRWREPYYMLTWHLIAATGSCSHWKSIDRHQGWDQETGTWIITRQ